MMATTTNNSRRVKPRSRYTRNGNVFNCIGMESCLVKKFAGSYLAKRIWLARNLGSMSGLDPCVYKLTICLNKEQVSGIHIVRMDHGEENAERCGNDLCFVADYDSQPRIEDHTAGKRCHSAGHHYPVLEARILNADGTRSE